jgi:glycosyltransferase involved in cell wall biosynthesis
MNAFSSGEPQSPSMGSVRILSAIGPGEVVTAYRDWAGKVVTASETSITFSSLEFDFFAKHRIPFWVISSNPRRELLREGVNTIENRPRVTTKPVSGIAYHLVQLLYAFSLLRSALTFRATHAIVDSGSTHWFALSLFRLFGIEVIPNLHNMYWVPGHPPKGMVKRIIFRLDKLFFRHCVKAALGVSPECGRQIAHLSGGRTEFFDYRAQFPGDEFLEIPGPSPLGSEIRIMFAGRIERNKGVFDLLRMCSILNKESRQRFVFEVCGMGSAFEELTAATRELQLESNFQLRGKLVRKDLLEAYARAHEVVVPTRSDFCEGLPMVCAEATLAGRPIVTSRLVPVLEPELLKASALEAEEESPEDYARKILELVSDEAGYLRIAALTVQGRRQFTDRAFGLSMLLENCISWMLNPSTVRAKQQESSE